MADSNPQTPAPLAGIRVLDLTRVLAGPYCTLILADLGAEVVKIERPGQGDDARHFGPFLPSGTSAYFASLNRGKKSVTLDLTDAADRRTFERLIERADVLVENFRPSTMPKLGLSEQRLRQLNPRLIYASASGFGRGGADGDRAAYDVIIQALSGLMSITGMDRSQPVRVGTSISDILTGMFTAIGILAALRRRDATQRGASLDMAMLDCTVAALENAVSRFEVTGQVPEPLGTRHPSITPFQAFETADAPVVIAAGNDVLWRKLCAVLDRPEMADDPQWATNELRTRHHAELETALNAILQERPADEWLARLDEAGVPAARIRMIDEVVADPRLAARGMLHSLRDIDGQAFTTVGSPFRFDGASIQLSPDVPQLGQHNDEVLRSWLG